MLDNLGNNVAGALYPHQIADAHILTPHLFAIVQRGARNGYTSHLDGTHQGDWSQNTGATDLNCNLFNPCYVAARGEFVGERPARMVRRRAKLVTRAKIVELDHDAVDLVSEAISRFGQLLMPFCDFTDC
jgi:hypothetical protein